MSYAYLFKYIIIGDTGTPLRCFWLKQAYKAQMLSACVLIHLMR